MQAKYRDQELNHAWGGRKSNTREINLQNTAFFYCKFIKYCLPGRIVFDIKTLYSIRPLFRIKKKIKSLSLKNVLPRHLL